MSERRLYLVRHGVAEDHAPSGSDFDRALTPEGRQKMQAAATGLVRLGVGIDVLVASPLVRAQQTADEIGAFFPGARRETWQELACGVDEISLTARVDEVDPRACLMLVGHEPDIGEMLAYWLTGRMGSFYTRVRKGSVSCLRAGALPPQGGAELEWMMTAKQLGWLGA